MTHGADNQVAELLTALVHPFAEVDETDQWMPRGFDELDEAQLHKAPRLLDPDTRSRLRDWWLAPRSTRAMTPNLDIAATCRIEGRQGLLLVEAKAHDEELIKESSGRRLTAEASDDRKASHGTIGAAIESARTGLEQATGHEWRISRDTHYQMSNRFAWSWKLTELGFPVVLVYLGFLHAEEMRDRGRPFYTPDDWTRIVKGHSEALFPEAIWDRGWLVNGQTFVPLIRSLDLPLDGGAHS